MSERVSLVVVVEKEEKEEDDDDDNACANSLTPQHAPFERELVLGECSHGVGSRGVVVERVAREH